jgi:folate-binding protein YgfZ
VKSDERVRKDLETTSPKSSIDIPPDYRAAKEGLAHRIRPAAVIDVEGEDRVAFLHGQLTQDVKALQPGEVRAAAGLTPKGKLLFIARLLRLPDRIRLLLTAASREQTLAHLKKYAVFQKVSVVDRSDEVVRLGLYGPGAAASTARESWILLPGEGEFSREILAPTSARPEIGEWFAEAGSTPVSDETAEILRIEAGRPRFGKDADESHLADEVGLNEAISTTKGCYVGQEIVARMRTYGRVNRRLVGFRFAPGIIPEGTLLRPRETETESKIEWGRVTSAVDSPSEGAIGLGYAFRDVPAGGLLISSIDSTLTASVAELSRV